LLLSHRVLFFRKHHGAVMANVYRVILGFSTLVKLAGWGLLALMRPGQRQMSVQKRQLHGHILKRLWAL
jgi:hypothetical protein